MTSPIEVLHKAEGAGLVLDVDPDNHLHVRPRQKVTPDLEAALREHRDGVVAALRLREIHRSWGFDPAGVKYIETAIASGRVTSIEVRLAELLQ